MTIREIVQLLNANIVTGEQHSDLKVEYAFSSDLMSDVLTTRKDNMLLITGLCNVQTIRTAEMSDIHCIIFARGKKASSEMVELAEENATVLIECRFSIFEISGILFQAGIRPVF
ncbi:MAG TPA: DRTGG domain-containing protein [Bacteroidales bacterium]|nr:DRTGG domain-containing protein [Bacteroidales bacterium]